MSLEIKGKLPRTFFYIFDVIENTKRRSTLLSLEYYTNSMVEHQRLTALKNKRFWMRRAALLLHTGRRGRNIRYQAE